MREGSARIDGRTIFGCLILNRYSYVRRVADEAPISGQIGIGNYRDGARAASRGWKRLFDEPIPLPRGRQLVTLEDAGTYITRLPKAEHEAQEWQAAMEDLDPGRDVGRTDDARADRRHEGLEPPRRARVQSGS
jgi:hypothetical protein